MSTHETKHDKDSHSHNKHDKSHEELTEDLGSLLTATAHLPGGRLAQVRERLGSYLDSAKETYETVRKETVAGAKATDKYVRKNPYQALGITLGVGILLGYFIGRRNNKS